MSGHLRTIDGNEYPVGENRPPIECFRCGVCCMRYQPPLMSEDIERVATGLEMSTEDFLSRYAQMTHVGYLLRHSEGRCVYLVLEEGGDRASCSIYQFRPEACRNWVASLSRRECQEGLTRLKATGKIMLASDLFTAQKKDVGRLSENTTQTE